MDLTKNSAETVEFMVEAIKEKLRMMNIGAIQSASFNAEMHEELYELYEMVMRKEKFSPSEMEAIAEELGRLRNISRRKFNFTKAYDSPIALKNKISKQQRSPPPLKHSRWWYYPGLIEIDIDSDIPLKNSIKRKGTKFFASVPFLLLLFCQNKWSILC